MSINIRLKHDFCLGFHPDHISTIHDTSAIQLFEEILEASPSVGKLLSYGYVPDFRIKQKIKIEMLECDLPNNKSVYTNYDFCVQKVLKWQKLGIVTERADKPICTNPLTLASKFSTATGKTKQRLCLDMSCSLNKLILDCHVKLDTLRDLSFILPENAFTTSTDFRQFFFFNI